MARAIENVLKPYNAIDVRIGIGKLNAQKYTLNGDIGIEQSVELNASIDKEYFNIELEDGNIVYSIETEELLNFIKNVSNKKVIPNWL
ncbi:MAG: hypothetical protein ACPL3B_03530 [Fervidobacterium sp.]